MTTYNQIDRPVASPVFSVPSILAILAAIGSFFVSPGMQIVLAIAAAVLGILGVIVSLSPARRGGIISFVSIALGGIALLIAIIRVLAGVL